MIKKHPSLLQRLKDTNMKLHATKIVQAYLNYQLLPQHKREEIKQAWAEYYEKCRNSDAGKVFYNSLDAWRNGDFATVKGNAEFASQLRLASDFMKKPSIFPYDPEELYWSPVVRSYLKNEEKIAQLEQEGGEYSDL